MLVLGLMSGTSADGLDIALCKVSSVNNISLLSSASYQYAEKTKFAIKKAQTKKTFSNKNLESEITQFVINSLENFLSKNPSYQNKINAIANHGQTILHKPNSKPAFSLQLGEGQTIADTLNIPVIDDFRSADIKAKGQGAPLIPAFHHAVFKQHAPCSIINIGGISNISIIEKDASKVIGFDIGPGNTLMDQWIKQHKNVAFDEDGQWAKSGTLSNDLLLELLAEPYFTQPFPKSTGQDLFNIEWLQQKLKKDFNSADIQNTLLELTATSISNSIKQLQVDNHLVYLCGGGAQNAYLVERIKSLLPNTLVQSTQRLGIHPQWVEAIGFAWLGYCHLENITANLPSVTGAKKKVILGVLHNPR